MLSSKLLWLKLLCIMQRNGNGFTIYGNEKGAWLDIRTFSNSTWPFLGHQTFAAQCSRENFKKSTEKLWSLPWTQTPEVKGYPEARSYILTLLDRPSVLAPECRPRLERTGYSIICYLQCCWNFLQQIQLVQYLAQLLCRSKSQDIQETVKGVVII